MWLKKKKEINIDFNYNSSLLSESQIKIVKEFRQYMIDYEILPSKGVNLFIDVSQNLGSMTTAVVYNGTGSSSFAMNGGAFNIYISPYPSDLLFEFVLYHELYHYLERNKDEKWNIIPEYNFTTNLMTEELKERFKSESLGKCEIEENLELIIKKIKKTNKNLYQLIYNTKKDFIKELIISLERKHEEVSNAHFIEYSCDLFSYNVLKNKGIEIDLNKIFKNMAFREGKNTHPNPYDRAEFLLTNKPKPYRLNSNNMLAYFISNFLENNIISQLFNCENMFCELESNYELTCLDYNKIP